MVRYLARAADPAPAVLAPGAISTFLGGVPSGTATNDVPAITILDAMNRALEHNLGVLVAEQHVGHASGTRWKALSDLLPNVNARISESRQVINLQSFGFGTSADRSPAFPSIVGPFNVFDARVYVSQSVVDLAAINNARAEAHNVEAARYTYTGARDLVVWVAGTLYVQALAGRRGPMPRARNSRPRRRSTTRRWT